MSASIFIILLFCACAQKNDWGGAEELLQKINSSGAYTEQLTALENPKFGFEFYGLEQNNFEEAMFCISTGATSEEFVYLKAADDSAFRDALAAAELRVKNQIEAFKNYNPAEVSKLQNAKIFKDESQKIVILCTASDYDKLPIK
jgi:hypothetical protein